MRVSSLIVGLVLGLTSSPALAQTAQRFDLVCAGTTQRGVDAEPVPDNYRIRVDLEANRWCWGACEMTFPIAEVAPDRLTFVSENVDTPRKRSMSENSVSRVTGEHRQIWIESRPIPTFLETKGQCEPGPFTGFPAARF